MAIDVLSGNAACFSIAAFFHKVLTIKLGNAMMHMTIKLGIMHIIL
jgi:hypothetical protein